MEDYNYINFQNEVYIIYANPLLNDSDVKFDIDRFTTDTFDFVE